MHTLEDLEIGVMFWAGGPARNTIEGVKALGVRCGQLGIPGDYELGDRVEEWDRVTKVEDFLIETIFCSYSGESYTDIPTVRGTVGFVPAKTRKQRLKRTKEVARFAAELQIESVACHIGFVPEDHQAPAYKEIVAAVTEICDDCAKRGQFFTLETGQEPAKVLLRFIQDVGHDNLKINFDPANMVLYGTGNPIEALDVLGKYVISVHCKDGDWPAMDNPEALGEEKPLGQGKVDMEQFISKLKEIGYRGPLCIEREEPDVSKRERDLRSAVELLKHLTGR